MDNLCHVQRCSSEGALVLRLRILPVHTLSMQGICQQYGCGGAKEFGMCKQYGCHAMLWLVTYSFLLRLLSEVSFLGLLLCISHGITLLMPGTSLVQVRT